jgi:F420 biosynthesis protein FbiB-like protein
MTPADLFELIRSRRSIRQYTDTPVSRAVIERLLEAAIWAPSAHNRQPWRMAVVTEAATKARLAGAMGARLRAERIAAGDSPDAIERDVARSYARLTGAPVWVLFCLTMAGMDVYPDDRRARLEQVLAVQSVAMAAQNLLLIAHAEGLGACWVCAPLFVPELVQSQLDLPLDWQPQGVVTLGYPAEQKEKTRVPLGERVKFLT